MHVIPLGSCAPNSSSCQGLIRTVSKAEFAASKVTSLCPYGVSLAERHHQEKVGLGFCACIELPQGQGQITENGTFWSKQGKGSQKTWTRLQALLAGAGGMGDILLQNVL